MQGFPAGAPALRENTAKRIMKHLLGTGSAPYQVTANHYSPLDETDLVFMDAVGTRKVFSANGLFDLATPFFITEYDLAHMELEPKLRGNIEFGYYQSGHMIYLNVDALKQLKSDLAGFYSRAVEGGN